MGVLSGPQRSLIENDPKARDFLVSRCAQSSFRGNLDRWDAGVQAL